MSQLLARPMPVLRRGGSGASESAGVAWALQARHWPAAARAATNRRAWARESVPAAAHRPDLKPLRASRREPGPGEPAQGRFCGGAGAECRGQPARGSTERSPARQRRGPLQVRIDGLRSVT